MLSASPRRSRSAGGGRRGGIIGGRGLQVGGAVSTGRAGLRGHGLRVQVGIIGHGSASSLPRRASACAGGAGGPHGPPPGAKMGRLAGRSVGSSPAEMRASLPQRSTKRERSAAPRLPAGRELERLEPLQGIQSRGSRTRQCAGRPPISASAGPPRRGSVGAIHAARRPESEPRRARGGGNRAPSGPGLRRAGWSRYHRRTARNSARRSTRRA